MNSSRIFLLLHITAIFAIIPYARKIEKIFSTIFASYQGAIIALAVLTLAGLGILLLSTIKKNLATFNLRTFKYLALLAAVILLILEFCQSPIEYAHIATYGLLAVLIYSSFGNSTSAIPLVLLHCLVSFGDESIQRITPGRVFDSQDLLINALGGLLGILLFLPLKKR